MAKVNKSAKKREWVQKGDHRTEIRNDDEELFPYWKGHLSLVDLKKVAREVLEWAASTKRPVMSDFCATKRLNPARMYEWMERSPELKEAWLIAKNMIGNDREIGAMDGSYNPSIVLAKMPLYDAEYREWKEKQASNVMNTASKIEVVLSRIDSDISPRKDEE